ncbi:MAG: WD40 repeat domain-containing protein [Candidatus Aminicenantes bacterium]|nr:WD40 repeat domain-containing protein [Candidatus Aminicenantes bacterium]
MKKRACLTSVVLIIGIALTAARCGRGGPDLGNIYREFHQAILAGDLETVLGLLTDARRQEMETGGGAEALVAARRLLPPQVEAGKVQVEGETAILEVRGDLLGQEMSGRVHFRKEREAWKVEKEEWNVSLETTEGSVALVEGEPFLAGPAEPPGPFRVLTGHQGEVTDLAFTPDGRFLISASYGDYTLRSWDMETGAQTAELTAESRITNLSLSTDGSQVCTADVSGAVKAYPFAGGQFRIPRVLQPSVGEALALSRDGMFLAVSGAQKPFQIWAILKPGQPLAFKNNVNLRTLAFSRSGHWLGAGGEGSRLFLWETGTWKGGDLRLQKVGEGSVAAAVDFSPDEQRVAIGFNDSTLIMVDVKKRRELHNWFIRDASVHDLKFSPGGDVLATAQDDGIVYLWDAESASRLEELRGHSGRPLALAFSPDGTVLATGGEDRRIVLWKAGASGAPEVGPSPQAGAVDAAGPAAGEEPERVVVDGQANLVVNPAANQGLNSWSAEGEVTVEQEEDGNFVYTIRYSGTLSQDVPVGEAAGRAVLVVARTASERIEEDGDQTGLPYLYGQVMGGPGGRRVLLYLQESTLTHPDREVGTWGTVWGVFEVPAEADFVRLVLSQSDGRRAQNGSAAWFDDVGVFVFDSRDEALAFARRFGVEPRG